MRVVVDAEKCVGHGRCYALAPDVFEADDRGHAVVAVDEVPSDLEAQARSAVANCPEQAISIEET